MRKTPVKHGLSKHPEYNLWQRMLQRCENLRCSAYPSYGGRGIRVCERWKLSFEDFLADMGTRPKGTSLDRYPNNDGNYEPGNCRWATQSQQLRNTRITKMVTYKGQTKPLIEWAEEFGFNHHTARMRLDKLGWTDMDEVFFRKPNRMSRRYEKSPRTAGPQG